MAVSYANRKVDLLIVQPAPGTGRVTFGLTGVNQVTAGIQKAAQWVFQCLLTTRGSIPYDLAYGTDLMAILRIGSNVSSASIGTAFGLAVEQLLTYQLANFPVDRPDDEVVAALTLVSQTLANGYATLVIKMTTRAGTSIEFLAPIPVVPN